MTGKHQVDTLIAGLEILKAYKANMSVYSSHRSGRCIETQEEQFANLTGEDRTRLLELGWWTNDALVWGF
jgi:hypothetical protein